jgi:hypothetical protein
VTSKVEQTLWISSVVPENVNGQSYVPTVLCYEPGGYSIGAAAQDCENFNTDFKIALGEITPGGSVEQRQKFRCSDGRNRSAFELSKDYFDGLLASIERKIPRDTATEHKVPARIIIAEPLSFQLGDRATSWISNYRANVRRILTRYSEVDFLPEPFAVYQYYRYGQKIPHLQDKTKNIAFIVDFGGGTFDACVIESTNKGDISQTGKHSKPLSADSSPVGGFYINREIAKYLLKRDLSDIDKKTFDKYMGQYERVLKGDLDESTLRDEAKTLFDNLRHLEKSSEKIKIQLSLAIKNWALNAEGYERIVVEKPLEPLKSTQWHKSEFFAHQFREVFESAVWDRHLKNTVRNVLRRASEALEGRAINITLISGGSANIKWLEKLLVRDFIEHIGHAEPVPISHSFQDVVANGLAIECARRFYSPESEFIAVTYNPVKLSLNPDDAGIEAGRRYKSIGDKVNMSGAHALDLIPSAQSLKHFFDEPLQWRTKLSKSPRHHLDYYFFPAENNGETDCYNVGATRVRTEDNKHFDGQIRVELTVREDGTASPRFIYQVGSEKEGVPENSVSGEPFYLDMTTSSNESNKASFYVGLDFGSSNSSVCLLSSDDIKVTTVRQNSNSWIGLTDALGALPFPVAISLRSYLQCKSDPYESRNKARECFESCLTFMAYVAVSEASSAGTLGKVMKSFQHRSMGPLKQLLQLSVAGLGKRGKFSESCIELFEAANLEKLNLAINEFTDHKHDKLQEFDHHQHVVFIVSNVHRLMQGKKFGYCISSREIDFSDGEFAGDFIVAHDNYPFAENVSYRSGFAIKPTTAILICEASREFLELSPLIFWLSRKNEAMSHGCYWYDKSDERDGVLVKPCDSKSYSLASELNENLPKVFAEFLSGNFKNRVLPIELLDEAIDDD